EKQKFSSDLRQFFWDEPFLFKQCADQIIRRCVAEDEAAQILRQCHSGPLGGHHGIATTARKVLEAEFNWPIFFVMHGNSFELATHVSEPGTSLQGTRCPKSTFRLFPGKLKSRWYGPFSISKYMKNEAIELCYEDGNDFIINKQRAKPYQKDASDFDGSDDINLEDEGGVTQDYNSTPKSLKELHAVPGDGVAITSDDVISYKRWRQDFQDGIRT
ncbi:hypothetical protein Tco_0984515, partial [Tanacetum coccineum]